MGNIINYIKVSFIGDTGVGKTSIIKAYFGEDIKNVKSTTGIDNYTIDKDGIKIVLWDFAGQRWFSDILIEFIKGSRLIVLVFDLSYPQSLSNLLTYWVPNIKKYANPNSVIILVGNKKDIQKIPDEIIGRVLDKMKEDIHIQLFIKTSALKKENIGKLFDVIMEIVKASVVKEKSKNNAVQESFTQYTG